MDVWTENDVGQDFGDGTVWRYNTESHIGSIAFLDGTHANYDAAASKLDALFKDGARIIYDAAAHAYSIALPSGASFSISLNGATLSVDAAGKVEIIAATDLRLKSATVDTTLAALDTAADTHVHSGVQSGSSNTGPPTAPIL